MPEIDDFKRDNANLKRELEAALKTIDLYRNDATVRGYYVQNKIANQQIDILEDFKLSEEIKKTTKDDKYYDRAKALWEGMPDTISGLNKLKAELKITGNEDKDKKNVPLIERLAQTRN